MMSEKLKIFLVEDDESFGGVMKAFLELNGYRVRWITDGKRALSAFREDKFDLCIFDVMLPGIDGFQVATDIKQVNENIPFIFLTAKTLREDILQGFKLGALDYITKPFDTEVLLLKINAILSRSILLKPKDKEVIKIGKLEFVVKERALKFGTNERRLSPKESELIQLLYIHRNKVLTRECALKTIWGDDNYFTMRSMDVYITKLRKYIKDDADLQIINVHGSGYMLVEKNS